MDDTDYYDVLYSQPTDENPAGDYVGDDIEPFSFVIRFRERPFRNHILKQPYQF